MSVLDETRSYLAGQREKLEAERTRIATERDALNAQIADIDQLLKQLAGFGAPAPTGRRAGIRDQVLDLVIKAGQATPADVRKALNMDDKAGAQSVANALSALKKAGKLTLENGVYGAAH